MTQATPVMISQSGLVSLPAAGNAGEGRRMASTKAHTSTTKAAAQSAVKNQLSGVITPAENTPLDYPVRAPFGPRASDRIGRPRWARPMRRIAGGAGGAGPVLGGFASRDPPRGWPEGQDLLDRWLGRPLTAALLWPVLRPLRAFCPRLASLSYSAEAFVRVVLTYPLARLDSVPAEASLRILVSQAVSSRSVSDASTPTPAAACTGLLSASLRISVLTSMVRFMRYLTLPGLNGQAFLGCAPALPRRSFPGRSRRTRRAHRRCFLCRCCPGQCPPDQHSRRPRPPRSPLPGPRSRGRCP